MAVTDPLLVLNCPLMIRIWMLVAKIRQANVLHRERNLDKACFYFCYTRKPIIKK